MLKYPEGVEGNAEIPGGDGGEAPLKSLCIKVTTICGLFQITLLP